MTTKLTARQLQLLVSYADPTRKVGHLPPALQEACDTAKAHSVRRWAAWQAGALRSLAVLSRRGLVTVGRPGFELERASLTVRGHQVAADA